MSRLLPVALSLPVVLGFQAHSITSPSTTAVPLSSVVTYTPHSQLPIPQKKNNLTTRYARKFKIDRERDDDDEGSELFMENIQDQFTTFGAEAVPEGQRPANEYINLVSSPLFDWANRPSGTAGLAGRLGILYVLFFGLICWPISGATFTQEGFVFHKLLSSHIGAFGVVMVLLIRLYSGWGYVGTRLQSKTIEYEETGW